ncbi:MAG TPA: DUF3108 domain-containing protein [Gammaproteobacteria bacterium]
MNPRIAGTLLLAGLMVGAAGAQAADSPLVPFHADFHLNRKGLGSGNLTFSLEKTADGYAYKSDLHTTGLAALAVREVTQTSSFRVVGGQLQAGTYDYKQTGNMTDSETIQFNWDKKSALTDREGKPQQKSHIAPGMSDTQLINLVVAADVATGKLAPEYKFLDHSKVTTYSAKALPDAKLTLGNTTYDTKVVQLNDSSGDGTATVWLAPVLHYLPVQIHSVDSKSDVTMTMQDITLGGGTPAAASK